MSSLISLRLLGPIEVRIRDLPPPPELRWRKHLAVALLLWTECRRPIARDRLLGMLWSDRPEEAARHSLNEALRVLRRSCGPDAICSTAESVTWVADLDTDTERFQQLVAGDRSAAAAIVRGPWCEGFAVPGAPTFDAWCEAERERWRGPLAATLARASGEALERGDITAAARAAEQAQRIHPWSEQAVLALMRARAIGGDRAGAIAAGQDHASRLEAELGGRAGSEVVRLLDALRRGSSGGATSLTSPPRPAADHPPFVGRGGELSAALAACDALTHGHGTGVLVLGASGSGRTRLLREVAERLRLRDAVVIPLRAVPGDGDTPDGGIAALADAIVRGPVAVAGASSTAIATLAAARPGWAERFPHADPARGMSIEAALLAVLRAAADERPVVIVIDDLDRLAPTAIASMTVMMRELEGAPIVWLLSADGTAPHPGVEVVGRLLGDELRGSVITLPSLAPAEIEALVEWGVADWTGEAKARLARRLHVEAAGSFFIAVELLIAVREGLPVPEPAETWPAADRTLDDTLPVATPTALLLAMRHAFGLLDPPSRALLQWMAVTSEPCATSALSEVPVELLDHLERRRWLVSDGRGYQIAARGVRRFIARETMTPGQRRRLANRPSPLVAEASPE